MHRYNLIFPLWGRWGSKFSQSLCWNLFFPLWWGRGAGERYNFGIIIFVQGVGGLSTYTHTYALQTRLGSRSPKNFIPTIWRNRCQLMVAEACRSRRTSSTGSCGRRRRVLGRFWIRRRRALVLWCLYCCLLEEGRFCYLTFGITFFR